MIPHHTQIAQCPTNVVIHEALLHTLKVRVWINWADGRVQAVTKEDLRFLWFLN